jgi:hypothetical protein
MRSVIDRQCLLANAMVRRLSQRSLDAGEDRSNSRFDRLDECDQSDSYHGCKQCILNGTGTFFVRDEIYKRCFEQVEHINSPEY